MFIKTKFSIIYPQRNISFSTVPLLFLCKTCTVRKESEMYKCWQVSCEHVCKDRDKDNVSSLPTVICQDLSFYPWKCKRLEPVDYCILLVITKVRIIHFYRRFNLQNVIITSNLSMYLVDIFLASLFSHFKEAVLSTK